ncbi:cytochrome oxidase putative small subunit CydP [Pseudothauera hydrothermalis]|uniref:cytochrome oxidase putative small subunit CydP n=1 Tax=Pseudothauera hydrothermalis TaxID=2184083 RepID=UPI000E091912|nr:cytochrome oxidase putative small subunit CydP [Pseudothauera hydrothermalis]
MLASDRKLLREIVVVVVLKLVLIAALWWGFIRDHKVEVDSARMAVHAAGGLQQPDDGETDGHRATR